MRIRLAYGKEYLDFEVKDNNLVGILQPNFSESNHKLDNDTLVRNALKNPIKSPELKEIIKSKNARNAVIVVNDITRPTPYQHILPPLLQEIETAGILSENVKLVVATGIHRPHTQEENLNIFGAPICSKYVIENHNCDDNLVSMGYLSNGMELVVNKSVAEADLLVTTGLVGLHYFAGYSGGRKSILPGVAGRSLIEQNHKMMSDKRACLGNYFDNPVNDIMIEAARLVGVDFIINVVTQTKNEIAYAAAGDLYYAWLEAVKYCEEMNVITIKEKADIVIAGCGGYPKDINMYQAQKALDSASLAVKDGGIIILAASCAEGLGEDTFAEWVETANSPEDIEKRFAESFELGGHKAYAICRTLKTAEIMLISDLEDKIVNSMFLKPYSSIDYALEAALEYMGKDAKILIMPEAPKIAVRLETKA